MHTDPKIDERMKLVLPLADEGASVAYVGGKGASLARLARVGLSVPDGFHLTTAAYRAVIAHNGLQPDILSALEAADPARPSTLESVARQIHDLFAGAEIPPDVATGIVRAYVALPGSNPAVAVRSSATAEDLPGASFAGQQETYLNVNSTRALLEATKRCWTSLWTARAIAYRARQEIPPEQVAMAVLVQLLVPAEAAGILFTANPVTGRRDQLLISAAWELGEAVVGGLVTPDSLVVEKSSGRVLSRDTASKEVMTVRANGGTAEQAVPARLRRVPVLDDAAAAELARLGRQIEQLYGMPMDVEWALARGESAIVQARPITALPPAERDLEEADLPAPPGEWPRPNPNARYMRTSIIDFKPDPLSPLFATMGISTYNDSMVRMMARVTGSENAASPEEIITTLHDYAVMTASFSVKEWWTLLGKLALRLKKLVAEGPDHFRVVALPEYREKVRRLERTPVGEMPAAQLWHDARALTAAAMDHLAILQVDTLGAATGSEGLFTGLYQRWFRREEDPPAATYLLGYDSAPIRAEKSLYDLARRAQEVPTLSAYLLVTDAAAVAKAISAGEAPAGIDEQLWQGWRERLQNHLRSFGHTLYDLDFARPVPVENPVVLLETVKMYLRGEGANPHGRQQKLARKREQATELLLARTRGVRGWALRKAFGWAQALAEVREDSIASIGLAYPRLRALLLELGGRMVATGAIDQADDIFWLEEAEIEDRLPELEDGNRLPSLRAALSERRQRRRAEARVTPPSQITYSECYLGLPVDLFLPEEGGEEGNRLQGVGASAGRVTGKACVLHGPQDFDQMQAGAILVAKLTTPAWTPFSPWLPAS